MPDITLHEPGSLQDASEMLRRLGPPARIMAGGTDLLVDLKTGRVRTEHVVSLARIRELRGVRLQPAHDVRGNGQGRAVGSEGGLRIGALTTISELHNSLPLAGPFAAIRDATREMAATQVRNLATAGGNLASAVPCADLPPLLLVMQARVVLWRPGGERSLPLEAFFLGTRRTAMTEGEILSEIVVPTPPPAFGVAYARFALRDGNAIAVAGVAAALTLGPAGVITSARIALAAVAPIPKLVPDIGTLLAGRRLADALPDAAAAAMDAAEPISDIRGSADYRRELVGTLTCRALKTAHDRAKEAMP